MCVCDIAYTLGQLSEINNGVSWCTELLSESGRTWLGCCPPLRLSGGTAVEEEGPAVIKSRLERFLL